MEENKLLEAARMILEHCKSVEYDRATDIRNAPDILPSLPVDSDYVHLDRILED